MQVNLLGYYGYHNIGDDLMLENLLNFLLETNKFSRINVFCRYNYYPTREKVRYIPLSCSSRYQKALQLLKNRYTFWGGGTCLYESRNNSGIFELARLQKLVMLAGNRFGFLGIGIGDLHSDKYISTAKNLLNKSFITYFRDKNSCQLAKDMLPNNNYCLGGDIVFLSDISPVAGKELKYQNISFSGHYTYNTPSQVDKYSKFLSKIINEFECKIHFLPAHTGISYNDNEFHKEIIKNLPAEKCQLHNWETPQDYIEVLKEMDFHLGIRLHSLVLADLLGIANCGISYSPKISAYLDKSNQLSKLRNINIDNKDIIMIIKQVKKEYCYPVDFIKSERISAYKCLKKVLEYV